jgi:hypothetical protein
MKILTFDIEDWFHIIHKYPEDILDKWDNYEVRIHKGMDKIFQVLSDHDVKATFFVVGYICVIYRVGLILCLWLCMVLKLFVWI